MVLTTGAMAGTPEHLRTSERRRERSPSRYWGRSPPRWAGLRGRSERQRSELIVECTVERATPAENFLILTKMNYYDWAALIRVMLQATACGSR
jgi:hypothetical protein